MTDLTELTTDDQLSIAQEPLSAVTFDVMDVEVEDIGLTEVVAVTLLSGSCVDCATQSTQDCREQSREGETYVLKTTTLSDQVEVSHVSSQSEWGVERDDIEVVSQQS